MQIGIVGLGCMGGNMARRLARGGVEFLERDVDLADIAPIVADPGEGRWTAQEAIEQGVPAPVMSLALMMRFASPGKSDYADKLLAMMRKGFGGHAVAAKDPQP